MTRALRQPAHAPDPPAVHDGTHRSTAHLSHPMARRFQVQRGAAECVRRRGHSPLLIHSAASGAKALGDTEIPLLHPAVGVTIYHGTVGLIRTPPSPNKVPLGSLRLFLPDIEALVKHLAANSGTVTIHAGNAIAPTPADLKEATEQELADVAIKTENPAVSIHLRRPSPYITRKASDPAAVKLGDEAKRLLEGNHAIFLPWYSYLGAAWIPMTILAIYVLFGALAWTKEDWSTRIVLTIFILAMGYAVASSLIAHHKTPTAVVIAARRSDWKAEIRNTRHTWLIG